MNCSLIKGGNKILVYGISKISEYPLEHYISLLSDSHVPDGLLAGFKDDGKCVVTYPKFT